jgi:hypothetical protein
MSARWQRLCLAAASVAAVLSLGGCGGGGGGSSSNPSTPNTQPVIVDGGPANIPNIIFTSVTVCAPGSSTNCQTIDHVQVDTGSTGLRIISSVLSPALSLPQVNDSTGNPIVGCAQFADGFSWGPVKLGDIHLAGESAGSVPIQIIGDPNFPTIPGSCSSSGPPENTVQDFGANGLLGIGLFLQDCGQPCVQSAIPGAYYSCGMNGCQPTTIALSMQLQNPVALFASDNNGVLIEMPSVPAAGAATATGTLIFGIGTQTDNSLGSATVLKTDPDTGLIVTSFNGKLLGNSYIDSGSTLFFFGTSTFPGCGNNAPDFYCPGTTQSLSATLMGINQTNSNVSFSVANAEQLFGANPSFQAFDNVAGPAGDNNTFAWGGPFFFGRNVFTAIEGRNTPGGQGPYFAF